MRFLGITRRPPNARYAPDEDAGRFQAYLNGELVVFPDLPELHLPAAGGTAPLNLCRTLDVQGADRLQIIFANSGGGGVWSQFGEGDDFGAGTPRRMTTGRTVMVPGLPGPPPRPGRPPTRPKPEALVLREYELLYQVDYVARPSEVVAEQPAAGGRGNEARPPRGLEPTRSDGGGTTPEPCREI